MKVAFKNLNNNIVQKFNQEKPIDVLKNKKYVDELFLLTQRMQTLQRAQNELKEKIELSKDINNKNNLTYGHILNYYLLHDIDTCQKQIEQLKEKLSN